MAGQQWFVRGGGKVYGPLDASRLKQLALEGKINGKTDVAKNAAGPWNPAGNVKGLFPAIDSPPALPELPPQGRGTQRAEDERAIPAAAGTVQRPENASGRESFRNWYRRQAGGWNVALQILAWLCGGYVFFPLWWLLRENALMVKLGAAIWVGFVSLLSLAVVMEIADPEGMKKARERYAQEAAESRTAEKLNSAKAAIARSRGEDAGHQAGFLWARNGKRKPERAILEAAAAAEAEKAIPSNTALVGSGSDAERQAYARGYCAGFQNGYNKAN